MPQPSPEAPNSSLNVHNVLAALFKHKKKILLATAAGFLAAAAVYFFYSPVYESDAALLVRYVLDRSVVDPLPGAAGRDSENGGSGSTSTTDKVIDAEVQILKSWDLAVQVAEALGAKRVLPDSKSPSTSAAAGKIFSGLATVTKKNSNIILVSYTDPHPEVATLVLNELLNRYFTKHLEVHRSAGAFDFVTQQTDQVRARLNQTEDTLKGLKAKAGIFELKDSTDALNLEAAKIGEQLRTTEADLAEQRARVKLMEGPSSTAVAAGGNTAQPAPATTPATTQAPNGDVQQYQALVNRLGQLRQTELDLLSKYTPANLQVKLAHSQIDDLEGQKRDLEKKFPTLAATVSSQPHSIDLGTERARLAGLEAKTEALKDLFANNQERMRQLSEAGPQIASLERTKQVEEANYKYFEGTLEKARVDEALDPSKMPNISAVQRPTPAAQVVKQRNKIALGLAVGGLALGVAFALVRELFLSKSVKRPLELETQLHTPVLLSIPYLNGKHRPRLTHKGSNGKLVRGSTPPSRAKIAPWEHDHFIRPYAEAIRDRLSLYFELNGMTHKPKLVGVTGMSEGAGASTLAAGLAAALSELSDGKVLLVDVNLGAEDAHPFFKGRPALPLKAALEPAAPMPAAADNLYLATANSSAPGPAQLGLKKFFDLMPNLKASDFDYIVFDMPPLTDTSPTMGIAGFLDRTLLVAEAEKNNREVVKRRYRALVASRDNVSVILNKTRNYVPKWLDGES